jgi:hypothetical protein
VGEEDRDRKELTETVKRTTAAVFIAIGLIVGGVGWALLPPDVGRYEYVVAVVDPRPLPESRMPAGLEAREVTRLHAFIPLEAIVQTARVTMLTRPRDAEGPAQVAMVQNMSAYIKSSDCELGRMQSGVRPAAAGAASGMQRGQIELGSHPIKIAALLGPLGPLFDEALWIESSPSLAAELEQAGWRPEVRYLLFTQTWDERAQVLAQLQADPDLLPVRGAEILSPAEPPALSQPVRLALAAVLVLTGLAVLVRRVRRMSRGEMARRLGRQ